MVRVVFDCAAKYIGTSLNDQLMQGTDLNNNLIGVLMRFRQEKFAIIADIESMFHQARVDPRDRDALHFLWWPNGELHSTPEEYKMTVHVFRDTSSPSCACFCLLRTLEDNKDKAIHGIAPLYIQDLVQVKSEDAYNLRSSRAVLLDAPSIRTKVTLGDRSFQVAAPKLWNSLPSQLRLINNIDIFKRHLKTYLFKVAFD